jgi:ATP-dependent helicase Lhr and Lhr-like helicase
VTPFEKLDPLVQHHIVNTLGWRELRPLQEQSIEPIQNGEHCLLLAPTAGGKTEAAIFPVLSRICSENWTGLSVLYICPLRALLNNLHVRLQEYCNMVGRRCGLWHGDVGESAKNQIRAQHPDILLTTPESLEVMLISARPEAREMLKGVRLVVIDEIHAFAGDDRGWHLLAVLERIGRLAGRELQRIGLSATVGNPEELLEWLAGHCEGSRRVLNPEAQASAAGTNVQLDYVGSLQNAAIVISRLHRGEKRLVFCDSRARVEELGGELRRLGVSTFLSHSSLSAEERRSAEEAFAQAQDCVIVATSTLELGIDVGDLDRVIQIDAPQTVASFLQRLGRTGRRQGALRNCLFLATNDNALLRAGALVSMWEAGFVEPVLPPKRPLHLFAQQLMALALQEQGIGVHDWRHWIGRLPAFGQISETDINRIIGYLLERTILFSGGARLSFGDEGVALYGRRHFLELVSVFTSPPLFKVLHGRRELGTVHQIAFLRHRADQPAILSLGGRSWAVTSLEWPKRIAYVIPAVEKGKSQWLSTQVGLSFKLCRGIHDLLTEDMESELWSSRAKERIVSLRNEFGFLDRTSDGVLVSPGTNEIRWFTFAGNTLNLAIADTVRQHGYDDVRVSDYWICVKDTTDHQRLFKKIDGFNVEAVRAAFRVPEEYLKQLKFSECLPQPYAAEIVKDRLLRPGLLEAMLMTKRVFIS